MLNVYFIASHLEEYSELKLTISSCPINTLAKELCPGKKILLKERFFEKTSLP
jgi:hypothetical protein